MDAVKTMLLFLQFNEISPSNIEISKKKKIEQIENHLSAYKKVH